MTGQLSNEPNVTNKNKNDALKAFLLTPNFSSCASFEAAEALRPYLPTLLAAYDNFLANTHEATFEYLDEPKKRTILLQAQRALYCYMAQLQLAKSERKGYLYRDIQTKTERLYKIISKLDNQNTLQRTPNPESMSPTFAWHFLQELAYAIHASLEEQALISAINRCRLYWVWGNGFITSFIALMPSTFFNLTQAIYILNEVSLIFGYLSFILYYTRLAINLLFLIGYTIGVTEEARGHTHWSDRFMTQWDLRKYIILNDIFWATANLACFFWLTGIGPLAYFGNVLTALLLLMDVALCAVQLIEACSNYHKEADQINDALNEMITLQHGMQDEPHNEKKAELQARIEEARTLLKHTEEAWISTRNKLILNLLYAAGLLLSFCLFSCFFAPAILVAPLTLMIIGIIGATLCFLLTVANPTIAGLLDIHATYLVKKSATTNIAALKKQCSETHNSMEGNRLFLEIKALNQTVKKNKQQLVYQTISLLHQVMIQAFLPTLVFVSLIFMPLGMGIGVLGAAFVIAALSKLLIMRLSPKDEESIQYDKITQHNVEQEAIAGYAADCWALA